MARGITVIVKTTDNDAQSAGVEVNTGTGRWEKFEAGGANDVFQTKNGPYQMVGSTFELARDGGGLRVGKFVNFDPETVTDRMEGEGLSDDIGTAISWKVNGIAEV